MKKSINVFKNFFLTITKILFTYIIVQNIGGRGGRKLDDVREKYQRACRRLHLVHNEYVLLIAEAQESEKDFQTIMMPAFMQHHKQELENIIADWLVLLINYRLT